MNITNNRFFNNKIIQKKQPITFKGYFACPLKAVHFQSDGDPDNLKLAQEFKQKVGLKESIDVFIQVNDKVIPPDKITTDTIQKLPIFIDCWAQDNKTITEDEVLINGINLHPPDTAAAEAFAKSINLTPRKLQSSIQGGNYFKGINDKDEYFAIIGENDRINTAKKIALEDAGKEVTCYGNLDTTITPYNGNEKEYEKKATLLIAKDLNIDPKNLFFIPQPNFHIDMELRPLNYPYILVNDYDCSIEVLKKAQKEAKDTLTKNQLEKLIFNTRTCRDFSAVSTAYTNMDIVTKELESYGFKVIKVPGKFDYSGTNFMNATVHQRPNGDLVYITNESCWHKQEITNPPRPNLNKLFEKALKEKVPQIKQVYFLSGPEIYHGCSYIRNKLEDKEGGIHCMTLEQPNFSEWREILKNKNKVYKANLK